MKVAYDYTIDGGINSFEKFLCGKVKRECPYLRGEGRFFFAFFVSFPNNRITYYKEVKKKERIQKIENKDINIYEDGYLISEKKLDIWGVFESKNSKIRDLVRESSNSGRNFIFYAKKKKFHNMMEEIQMYYNSTDRLKDLTDCFLSIIKKNKIFFISVMIFPDSVNRFDDSLRYEVNMYNGIDKGKIDNFVYREIS